VSGPAIVAIAAGGAVLVLLTGFYLVANNRRVTLWTADVARFVVAMTVLWLLLAAVFATGGALAVLVPPILLLAGGVYLLTLGSKPIGAGMTARPFGILVALIGASGLVLGLVRLALDG